MPPERLAHPHCRHPISRAPHSNLVGPLQEPHPDPVVTPHHGDSAYAVFAGDDNYGQGQTHPLADVERRVRELHAAKLAIARDDEEHRNNRGRAARLTTARV